MELLTIEKLVEYLENEFRDLDAEIIEDLLLKPTRKTTDDTEQLKKKLGITAFPSDFETLIYNYDFGNFTLQNVQFGYDEDYFERLKDLNNPDNYWSKDAQNAGVIVIANGDPFTILLDDNGFIYAISAEIPFEQKMKIANSFTHFLQGLGTSFKTKRENKNQDFLALAEQEFGTSTIPFWKYCV